MEVIKIKANNNITHHFYAVSNINPVLAFVLPAMVGYFLWWIPYTAWLLLYGLDHSMEKTGKNTVFRDSLNKNSTMCSVLLGKKSADQKDLANRWVGLKYMIFHFILCHIAFLWSYLCYTQYLVHSAFCIVLFISCVHNGGVKYYKMTTKWYLKAVESILSED